MGEREHVAVDQVEIAALAGDAVEIFQGADVVGAHPPVLSGDGVAIHARGVVAAEEIFEVESDEETRFLLGCEQGFGDGLFPAHPPRAEGVLDELEGLLLDVGGTGLVWVTDHVWWDPEDAGDFVDLEFAGLQELGLLGGETDEMGV